MNEQASMILSPGKMKTSDNYSTVIYSICVCCNKFLGTKNGYGLSGISHGICKKCRKKY